MYLSFFIHLSVEGHLGCFHVLAIINSASMNTGVHMSLSILIASVCMPSSGITGFYGSSISNFSRDLHTAPHSGCTSLHSHIKVFLISQFFTSGGQNIGVSASTSVLPMNTQDWSPLGWTGWISLQSKGLSRVFSYAIIQKDQFFSTHLSLWSSSHDYWKNHSFE